MGKRSVLTMQNNSLPLKYNPALDSIRGIAVLLVVSMHVEYYFFDSNMSWIPGGFLGVDLFFVLSGFLITNILLSDFTRHGKLSYRKFYINRLLRLFPALALLLLAYFTLSKLIPTAQPMEFDTIFAILFYYFNWFLLSTLDVPEGMGHMWSLAVEEQFYLLWPALLALVLRHLKPVRYVVFALVVLIASVAVWRAYLWNLDTNWLFLYVRTDTRADSILVGALLAYLLSKNLLHIPHLKLVSGISACIFLICVLYFDRESPALYLGGFTLLAILGAVLICYAIKETEDNPIFFDWKPLRWLGKLSYGLYLWHMPIFMLVSGADQLGSSASRAFVGLALLSMTTLVSWFFVERPCLRLKNRI
ncbi:MAG: peptidoglycan/LPS O-acetylase OafA/YrhL [Halioglobus sp.]